MKIKISIEEIRTYLDIEKSVFSKYAAPLINLANFYAQGTRPKIVGQMSELIKEFDGKTLSEWEKWYLEKKPDAIKNATEKILQKLKDFKNTLDRIDAMTVEQWVRDLVIVGSYVGLKFQEAILKKGAEIKGIDYRLARPDEEAKGIDGYIEHIPVSIKPHTYEAKKGLPEDISVGVIFYKKVKGGIEVDYGEILE